MSNRAQATQKRDNLFKLALTSPYLLLLLAPFFWGGNIIVGKLAVGEIDPIALVLARWLGAVILIAPFAYKHLKKDWAAIRPMLVPLLMFGALGYAAFNLLMYSAALHTSAVNISIEQAAIPIFVFVGNLIFFGVRPKPLQVIGLLLTVAGVVWVTTHGNPIKIASLAVNIGDGMVICACLLYAAYSLLLRFRPDMHWLSFIFVSASGALVTAFIVQGIWGGGVQDLTDTIPNIGLQGWLCVTYAILFPSIIAQLFYVRGVEAIGPNRASLFINLLPVFGTVQSVLILGENFETFHVVASIMVVSGIVLAEYSVRQSPLGSKIRPATAARNPNNQGDKK